MISCAWPKRSAGSKAVRRAGAALRKLLHPPGWVMCALPPAGGAGLALVFAAGLTQSPAAWPVYAASVYALAVWAAALPGLVRRLRAAVRDSGPARVLRSTQLGRRYLDDAAFRGGVALCRGMAVNFLYALFRITEGIRYRSVWFISLAVYDLMLGPCGPAWRRDSGGWRPWATTPP